MMRAPSLYDVAIVGFGPTGAIAAGLLSQGGASVYVCDQSVGVCEFPRALSIDHEVLRTFQQLGIADRVAPYYEPFTPSEYLGVEGQVIRRMTMLAPPFPQGHVPSAVFTQPAVERVLREEIAARSNVCVAEGVRCTALTQDAQGVTLVVDGAPVRARWVIACDGAASTVRELLEVGLEDLAFDEPWLVVDVLCNECGLAKLPKTSVQYCEPWRPCSFIIGPRNHRRWEFSLRAGETPEHVSTPEAIQSLLARWIAPEDGLLLRQSTYRFHALLAERWRSGRVFLAGDAAHMQPPFLGQGLCQGVRDVANLSWKLAAVLRAELDPLLADALLDSYELERKTHARELIARIKAIGAVICERDLARAQVRDARLLDACRGAVQDTPRQDVLPRLTRGAITATPGAGTLFPQPRLAAIGGSVLLDARYGYGFLLVSDGTLAIPSCEVRVLDLASEPETEGVVASWFARHGARVALVRPDHYVFGSAADETGLHALLAAFRKAGFSRLPSTTSSNWFELRRSGS